MTQTLSFKPILFDKLLKIIVKNRKNTSYWFHKAEIISQLYKWLFLEMHFPTQSSFFSLEVVDRLACETVFVQFLSVTEGGDTTDLTSPHLGSKQLFG